MTTGTDRKRGTETILETKRTREDELLQYVLYREERRGRDSYSIRALQYKRGIKICQATVCDVSSVYETAKLIFDMIVDGFVEPYVLCDVIYDLLP